MYTSKLVKGAPKLPLKAECLIFFLLHFNYIINFIIKIKHKEAP